MAVGAFAVPAIVSFQLDSLARAGTFSGKKEKHPKHDCPNQTEPNQTWPNQSDPKQTWPTSDAPEPEAAVRRQEEAQGKEAAEAQEEEAGFRV